MKLKYYNLKINNVKQWANCALNFIYTQACPDGTVEYLRENPDKEDALLLFEQNQSLLDQCLYYIKVLINDETALKKRIQELDDAYPEDYPVPDVVSSKKDKVKRINETLEDMYPVVDNLYIVKEKLLSIINNIKDNLMKEFFIKVNSIYDLEDISCSLENILKQVDGEDVDPAEYKVSLSVLRNIYDISTDYSVADLMSVNHANLKEDLYKEADNAKD